MNEYFKRPVHQIIVTRPLEISEVATSYDVKCSVKGGGLSGKLEQLFGISKALFLMMKALKKNLKKINSPPETHVLLNVKSTVTGKQEEAFSF